jgi:hypothetical protein
VGFAAGEPVEASGIPHLTPTLSAPRGGEGVNERRHRAGIVLTR